MEHAKKLMLVEPKLYRASMREKTLSRLDEEIENTLNSELSDSDKALKYIDALRRYKYYGEEPQKKEKEKSAGEESEILATVSGARRHKAKQILDHLKRDPSFKIGDEGEIIYKQQKLYNSRVGDLLNDILQKKSTVTDGGPLGWQEFSDSLKSLGVSRDLVENSDRWRYMHPPTTPPPPTPPPPPQLRKKKQVLAFPPRGPTVSSRGRIRKPYSIRRVK